MNTPRPSYRERAFTSCGRAQAPVPRTGWPIRLEPKRLGPGSSSLDVLIERESTLSGTKLAGHAVTEREGAIPLPFRSSNCSDKPVENQCQEKNGVRSDISRKILSTSTLRRKKACPWLRVFGDGSLRYRERGSSCECNRGGKSQVPAQHGRWPREGLPVQGKCRWVSRLAQ